MTDHASRSDPPTSPYNGDQLVHATCIDVGGAGVLLQGPPGSGKSSLALRLIDGEGRGLGGKVLRARLIGDDQVMLTQRGERITAHAPEALAGLLEIRGLGLVRVPFLRQTMVGLAVTLEAAEPERCPDRDHSRLKLIGVSIPLLRLNNRDASAPARVRAALSLLTGASLPTGR